MSTCNLITPVLAYNYLYVQDKTAYSLLFAVILTWANKRAANMKKYHHHSRFRTCLYAINVKSKSHWAIYILSVLWFMPSACILVFHHNIFARFFSAQPAIPAKIKRKYAQYKTKMQAESWMHKTDKAICGIMTDWGVSM